MLKNDKTVRRYSEAFKLKVLHELDSGKYCKTEILRIYGIGSGSLYGWIKKYSRFDLLNTQIRIQTMNEKDKIKSLEEEIRQLKELLVQKDLNGLVNEAFLDHTAKQLGYKDLHDLKKKLDLK